jgi:hypothetical protein
MMRFAGSSEEASNALGGLFSDKQKNEAALGIGAIGAMGRSRADQIVSKAYGQYLGKTKNQSASSSGSKWGNLAGTALNLAGGLIGGQGMKGGLNVTASDFGDSPVNSNLWDIGKIGNWGDTGQSGFNVSQSDFGANGVLFR